VPRLSADEARRRFAHAQVARLATVGPGAVPHLVPVVFAVDGDEICTVVDAKPKAGGVLARLRNVTERPAVSLLADEYDPDWSRLWWVRADGLGRVVESGPERERAVHLLTARYPQYAALEGGFGAALIVRVARWQGWAMRRPEEVGER